MVTWLQILFLNQTISFLVSTSLKGFLSSVFLFRTLYYRDKRFTAVPILLVTMILFHVSMVFDKCLESLDFGFFPLCRRFITINMVYYYSRVRAFTDWVTAGKNPCSSIDLHESVTLVSQAFIFLICFIYLNAFFFLDKTSKIVVRQVLYRSTRPTIEC